MGEPHNALDDILSRQAAHAAEIKNQEEEAAQKALNQMNLQKDSAERDSLMREYVELAPQNHLSEESLSSLDQDKNNINTELQAITQAIYASLDLTYDASTPLEDTVTLVNSDARANEILLPELKELFLRQVSQLEALEKASLGDEESQKIQGVNQRISEIENNNPLVLEKLEDEARAEQEIRENFIAEVTRHFKRGVFNGMENDTDVADSEALRSFVETFCTAYLNEELADVPQGQRMGKLKQFTEFFTQATEYSNKYQEIKRREKTYPEASHQLRAIEVGSLWGTNKETEALFSVKADEISKHADAYEWLKAMAEEQEGFSTKLYQRSAAEEWTGRHYSQRHEQNGLRIDKDQPIIPDRMKVSPVEVSERSEKYAEKKERVSALMQSVLETSVDKKTKKLQDISERIETINGQLQEIEMLRAKINSLEEARDQLTTEEQSQKNKLRIELNILNERFNKIIKPGFFNRFGTSDERREELRLELLRTIKETEDSIKDLVAESSKRKEKELSELRSGVLQVSPSDLKDQLKWTNVHKEKLESELTVLRKDLERMDKK